MGMGVDALPEDIRTSRVLTGNQLAMLGGAEALPDETDVNEHKLLELADLFMEHEDDGARWSRPSTSTRRPFWTRAWWMKRGKHFCHSTPDDLQTRGLKRTFEPWHLK